MAKEAAAGEAGKKERKAREKKDPKQLIVEKVGDLRRMIFDLGLPRDTETKLLADSGALQDAIKEAVKAVPAAK